MKLIIAGSRDWTNYARVCEFLDPICHQVTEVVSGKCPTGADGMGERWARENDIPVKGFPPDWKTHGKAAGPIRNRQMAEYADALILFWSGHSPGSKNMLDEALKRGLQVTSVTMTAVDYH